MKIINKPIEVVCWCDSKGNITPIRFRIGDESNEKHVIKIQKIMTKELEKLAGNLMMVFTCLCIDAGIEKIVVLKYELSTCRWLLFKL